METLATEIVGLLLLGTSISIILGGAVFLLVLSMWRNITKPRPHNLELVFWWVMSVAISALCVGTYYMASLT